MKAMQPALYNLNRPCEYRGVSFWLNYQSVEARDFEDIQASSCHEDTRSLFFFLVSQFWPESPIIESLSCVFKCFAVWKVNIRILRVMMV